MSVGPAMCRWSLTRFSGQITDGAKVGLATELRYREKVMATTWSRPRACWRAVERRQDGLVDLEREVRRDRCTAEEMEQLEQRRWYLVIGEQDEAARPSRCPKQTLVENAEHRRKYNAMLEAAKEAYTFEKTPSFTR